MALTMVGVGSNARIPVDKAQAGGFIPADPAVAFAGFPAEKFLSPDPATAEAQKAKVTVVP